MTFKPKLVISGISSLLLFGIANTSTAASEFEEVRSTLGYQFEFLVGVSGENAPRPEFNGKIIINQNFLKKNGKNLRSETNQGRAFFRNYSGLALPMTNTGSIINFDILDPYLTNDPEINQRLFEDPTYYLYAQEPTFPWINERFIPSLPSFILSEVKISPPIAINIGRIWPDTSVIIDIPGLGINGSDWLPKDSIKKIDRKTFVIKFDTCELEYLSAFQCGIIDVTIKANGKHISKFTGKRVDRFNINNKKLKLISEGKFSEKTANVSGSIFGEKLHPYLDAVFSYHNLSNTQIE